MAPGDMWPTSDLPLLRIFFFGRIEPAWWFTMVILFLLDDRFAFSAVWTRLIFGCLSGSIRLEPLRASLGFLLELELLRLLLLCPGVVCLGKKGRR